MALLASNAVTAAVRQALTHGLASIASQAKTIRDGAVVPDGLARVLATHRPLPVAAMAALG